MSQLKSLSLRRIALVLAVLPLAALSCGDASATKVYRWTDANGVAHYGDRAPDKTQHVRSGNLRIIPVRAEAGAMVRLRVEGDPSSYQAWADNTLAGPIEVMLRFDHSDNVVGDPILPARATVPAHGSALVARIGMVDAGHPGQFALRLDGIPGDPNARPQDVQYLLPLRQAHQRVDQGFGGSFSHADPQNYYAVDFAADIGTTVLAARDGIVMQVESDFDKAGLDMEKFGGRANYVRILHADGSMGLYAHLEEGGVLVRVGQQVRAGQPIGLSGNTGFTTGPHLHFAVQVNRGMRLESIPFRMSGPQGALSFASRR